MVLIYEKDVFGWITVTVRLAYLAGRFAVFRVLSLSVPRGPMTFTQL